MNVVGTVLLLMASGTALLTYLKRRNKRIATTRANVAPKA